MSVEICEIGLMLLTGGHVSFIRLRGSSPELINGASISRGFIVGIAGERLELSIVRRGAAGVDDFVVFAGAGGLADAPGATSSRTGAVGAASSTAGATGADRAEAPADQSAGVRPEVGRTGYSGRYHAV